jgi:putative peptidoglycan lipid II flippase
MTGYAPSTVVTACSEEPHESVEPGSAAGAQQAGHRHAPEIEAAVSPAPPTPPGQDRALAGDSLTVARWTLVSRITGFGRVIVIAAVLGPTFFANLYVATNLLPNMMFELLVGPLFTSLLVPALTRRLDQGDRDGAARVAGGFLGIVLTVFALITAAVILLGPLVVGVLTAGVNDPEVVASQRRVGWLLLALLVPQVLLYGSIGVAVAVQHAHGRFALPSAASAVENLGVIATLGAVALLHGTGTPLDEVSLSQVLLLGLGTTAAVALHAGLQWWGARRAGTTLVPERGWREPHVLEVVRLAVPSMGYAGANALRRFGILVVAGSIPGGVVAFDLATNFYNLPVALAGRPVAAATLPRLSRLHEQGDGVAFHDTWLQGARLTTFLTIPAAVGYLVLAGPLSRLVSFGAMGSETGMQLVATSLAALAVGTVGESSLILSTQTSYAMRDARSPLRAVTLRVLLAAVGMGLALTLVTGPAVLLLLGLTISFTDVVAATYLSATIRRRLPPATVPLGRPLLRTLLAAALMGLPAWLVSQWLILADVGPRQGALLSVVTGSLVGALSFGLLHYFARSDEFQLLAAALGRGSRQAG